ncbi:MAG: DUF1893 domain-containing protein [Tissierellia bacterium]|nr:DUF1893 domain-containing protein [Tissierellia bacterium]
MKDIELAIKVLEEEDLTMVAVRNGELIYKSREKGIKPMYTLATKMGNSIEGLSIADRVIGRGAAILCIYVGAKEVHGKLISKMAMDLLKEGNIEYSYDNICNYIKNRDGTDMCPIEKMAMDIEDPILLLDRIKKLLHL